MYIRIQIASRVLRSRYPIGSATSARRLHASPSIRNIPSWPAPPMPQPPVGPSDNLASGSGRPGAGAGSGQNKHRSWYSEWAHSPSFQAALTTVVGLAMVFGAGVGYLEWYKGHVLRRVSDVAAHPRDALTRQIMNAFAPGYVCGMYTHPTDVRTPRSSCPPCTHPTPPTSDAENKP